MPAAHQPGSRADCRLSRCALRLSARCTARQGPSVAHQRHPSLLRPRDEAVAGIEPVRIHRRERPVRDRRQLGMRQRRLDQRLAEAPSPERRHDDNVAEMRPQRAVGQDAAAADRAAIGRVDAQRQAVGPATLGLCARPLLHPGGAGQGGMNEPQVEPGPIVADDETAGQFDRMGQARYSTVTDFARLRGWSTSVPFSSATS